MSLKLYNFLHSVYLVSWSNVSNKPLKTIFVTFNKTFSFLVVWLGGEILIFRKDYHRNNDDVYCLMLLEGSYNIFRLSSNSARSTIVILANLSCRRFALGQRLSFSNGAHSIRFRKEYMNRKSTYRVSQEACARLREGVPYAKLYRYNPKHLRQKWNGYGDNGQRKVWSFCGSTHCTCRLTLSPPSSLNVVSHDKLSTGR